MVFSLAVCFDVPGLAQAGPEIESATGVRYSPRVTKIMRSMGSGELSYTVKVGRDGRARRCKVTRSSGSRAVDAAICRDLRRNTRYSPATDKGGRPVPGTFSRQFLWHDFRE